MRIISLTQPSATLIAVRAKTFETRSWGTTYRGPVAIHAAKSLSPIGGVSGLRALFDTEHATARALQAAEYPDADALPLGAIVAVCTIAECYHIQANGMLANQTLIPLPGEPERSFGNYTPGRYAWKLVDIQPLLQPLPYRGAQGLRTIADNAVVKAIYERVQ